jgi:hypothetical protein
LNGIQAEYDRQLRAKMKQKAEDDVKRRAIEAEERKARAEAALAEIQEKEAWEAEQRRLAQVESDRLRRDRNAREMVMQQASDV